MLKYFKLRKSLFSKSKRSISSPPRSIPHVRDIDEINPAQLDSGQKLINDSIRTMSDNMMAKFSSMFDQYQSRQHNISCTGGNQPPVLSQRPVSKLTESRVLQVVDFRRATRIRYSMRILVFAIGSWTRLLRLLGILQGIPESRRICAELQPLSGITRLELVFIRNLTLATAKIMMMMLEILKRMLHNLIGTMYD